jgi:hypothetical protein
MMAKAGLLASGSGNLSRAFPLHNMEQWLALWPCGRSNRLQRRVRNGFSPFSLLVFPGKDAFDGFLIQEKGGGVKFLFTRRSPA